MSRFMVSMLALALLLACNEGAGSATSLRAQGRVDMQARPVAGKAVYPGAVWERRAPEAVGLSRAKLDALRDLVGGRGCVVRHGYMVYTWGDQAQSSDIASAVKPVISTLLLFAVQERKLKSVDDAVADFEPRLRALNGGKDARITWRHLASQTSGYGLMEAPGEAYSYNDYALALYYDLLTARVFRQHGTEVLKTRLADALQFEDRYTFEAFGPDDRPGRLAMSVRDLARFGLLYLRGGKWRDRQLIKPELIKMTLDSPIRADLPLTSGKEAAMLPDQRTLGGNKNITPVGPGYYSFNWWLNRTDKAGKRLFIDAPPDAYVASGHGGRRMLWVIPSLDLLVSWNDADVKDHDSAPGNPESKLNRAARLIREAVSNEPRPERRTAVSIFKDQWRINGEATYRGAKAQGLLLNARMVNAVFEDAQRADFDADANTEEFIAQIPDYVAHGVRAFTLSLQGGMPGYEGAINSAFSADGSLREAYLKRVRRVIEACDRSGAVVILGCYYQRQDQLLKDENAVRAGVMNVARWIKDQRFTNVALEITNEFGHSGFAHWSLKTAAGQVELIQLAKRTAPALLVSTSGTGNGKVADSVAAASDFILIHLNETALDDIPNRIAALKKFGKPVVCNEDARTEVAGARAAELCVAGGASWGLMVEAVNQRFPFAFNGHRDAPVVYASLKQMTTP